MLSAPGEPQLDDYGLDRNWAWNDLLPCILAEIALIDETGICCEGEAKEM